MPEQEILPFNDKTVKQAFGVKPISEFSIIEMRFKFTSKAKCNDCNSSNIGLLTEIDRIDTEDNKQ